MPYNMTAIGGVNSTLGLVQNVNSVLMRDMYGVLMLIAISIIFFISFMVSTKNPMKAFTGASWIAFALSILLRAMSLVPDIAIWITLIGAAVGVAFWNLD